jgi:hypothetical protein
MHHPFNYPDKSTLWSEIGVQDDAENAMVVVYPKDKAPQVFWDGYQWNEREYYRREWDRLQSVVDQFKVVVMMHSWYHQIKKRDYQKFGVFHGGTAYREGHGYMCEIFNKFVDVTLIQHANFFGWGAKNEKWLIPPLNTDAIVPVFSEPDMIRSKGITFRHNPRGEKGSEIINKVMKKFQSTCNYKYSQPSEIVPWADNIKRMSDCDIYIESLISADEWGGITVLEAASLGKIVITRFTSKDKNKYNEEFKCNCPIIGAEAETLESVVKEILKLSPENIIAMQHKSREWIEGVHGYIPTGHRLKELFEL